MTRCIKYENPKNEDILFRTFVVLIFCTSYMDLLSPLHQFGLNRSEIKIYLFLLEQGVCTPPQIAKATGIARTNCYNVVRSLVSKGLVEDEKRNKRRAYIACDPASLLRAIDRQKEAIERAVPDLRTLYLTQQNKPKIRFFEGLEEIQEIYLESLGAKKICAIGSIKQFQSAMPKFFDVYQNQIQRRGIVYQDIISAESEDKVLPKIQSLLKGYYEAKILSAKYTDVPTDILIWGSNVALINFQTPAFGTLITNNLIADTFNIIFDVLWENRQNLR